MRYQNTISNERGVSTVVGYVLNIGVGIVLISSLMFITNSNIREFTERGDEAKVEYIISDVKYELNKLDNLEGTVSHTYELPEYAVNYDITVVDNGSDYLLQVSSGTVSYEEPILVDSVIDTPMEVYQSNNMTNDNGVIKNE